MRRLGSRVTIIQHGPRLLDREDADVSKALLELMTEDGVDVLLQAAVLGVEGRSGASVALLVKSGETETTVEGSDILIAAGRLPNVENLSLDRAGVDLDARGYISVNEKLQTTAEQVWAMGNCAGSPQFTHAGYDDFRVVLSDITGGNRTTHKHLIPYCLFTDGVGPRRYERIRGYCEQRLLQDRQNPDGERDANANDIPNPRVHEGTDRR